tara:strand:+ start:699 stop:1733 length:1035 start_codon:yes stop_codon:yes gene_type:complete
MYHVIIAGGKGSRFWPWSTEGKPKQVLKIFDNKTMIRHTVDRILEFDSSDNIFIIANFNLLQKMRTELPEIPDTNFILEPSAKNTAPAIGLAAFYLYKRDPNAIMIVYPSDHFIKGEKFKKIITSATNFAKKRKGLITIGIKPTYPATGYGYIEADQLIDDKHNIYSVKNFIEKPKIKLASKYFEQGTYYWNSGIFIWSLKSILQSIQNYMPDTYIALTNISKYFGTDKYDQKLVKYWQGISGVSIDYGILENEEDVFVVPGEFLWNDIGNWKSLYDLLISIDKSPTIGNVIHIDSNNNLIISPNRLTATIGLENMIIININNSTLVMPMNDAERVKEIINQKI